MKEVLYNQDSFLITGTLLVQTVAATEAGHRMGRRARAPEREEVYRAHIELDRPRRGLIRIDRASMVELKSMIDGAEAALPQASKGFR